MEYLGKKSRFPFCKFAHLLVMNYVYANKWNILQKVDFFFTSTGKVF